MFVLDFARHRGQLQLLIIIIIIIIINVFIKHLFTPVKANQNAITYTHKFVHSSADRNYHTNLMHIRSLVVIYTSDGQHSRDRN